MRMSASLAMRKRIPGEKVVKGGWVAVAFLQLPGGAKSKGTY